MNAENVAALIRRVTPYTMTQPDRITALIEETERVVLAGIPGVFMECGVWRGGSMMTVALTLLGLGVRDRELYLFDTFEGMTPPEDIDVDLYGVPAAVQDRNHIRSEAHSDWCFAPLLEVQAGMESTGYPVERCHYVEGRVEDTLPFQAPGQIALLRVDTDFYASTKCEFEYLFPRISPGGTMIVDDYGHWRGSKQATDEYLEKYAPEVKPIPCGYSAVILRKT